VLHRFVNSHSISEKKSIEGDTGFSVLWEVCRPLYLSLPPQAAVHGYLSEGVDDLVILLLHVNTNIAEKNISFEQANKPVPNETYLSSSPTVPKCCLVGEFRHYTAFQIRNVAGHNVLLKFKGGGGMACELEPRMGSSVKRVGVFAKLLSSSSKKEKEEESSTLDFSTNISVGDIQYLHSSFRY